MSGIRRAVASEKGLSAHGSWVEADKHGAPRTPLEPRARRRSRLPMSKGCNLRCCLRSCGERTSLRPGRPDRGVHRHRGLRSCGERTSLRLRGGTMYAIWRTSPLLWGADFVEAASAPCPPSSRPGSLRSCGERTSLRLQPVMGQARRVRAGLRSCGERTSLRPASRERLAHP